MISNSVLGQFLVLLSLLFAAAGSVAGYVAGSKRNRQAWLYARNSAYGFSGSMILANLLMVYALYTNDFSVHYVAQVGSTDTPRLITVISLWSSLEGSILFWGGILGGYVALTVWSLGEKHREFTPWAIHVMLMISAFFAVLIGGVANPFEAVANPPLDGPGPNPLLQNHWLMAVHPPTLYLGYVGMSVPFALICAALLAGRFDVGWMGPVRRWMLIPWGFLSLGILLGGWWSYAVLGWGGAWAWDPVENASFLPWLTGTAFLHSAMVLQRRGKLRDWTLLLGMATFLLTLLGTFMTRSGVFNSVHSFTQSDIGPIFLAFIAVVFTYSLMLVAFRSHLLDEHALRVEAEFGKHRSNYGPLSREGAIVLQNAVFSVFTITVLTGTLLPLIQEAVNNKRVSVGEPYFNEIALPLGEAIVFLMAVGPALPWGRITPQAALRRLAPALGVGVAFGLWALLAGFGKPHTVFALFLVGFALWANLWELLEPIVSRVRTRGESPVVAFQKVWGRARRRFGGHVAHYGVLFAVFSLALSKGYREEVDFTLTQGQTVPFGDMEVKYVGFERQQEAHRVAEVAKFELYQDGQLLGTYDPRMNRYPTQREPIVTPSVRERPTGDVYFSLIDLGNDGDTVVVRVINQPYQVWLWLSGPLVLLGVAISIWPQRERRELAAGAELQAGSAK